MPRCLKCAAPADIQLHSSGPEWPAGLKLDLCADHATLALATGEAVVRDPGIELVPVSLGVSIGSLVWGTIGIAFCLLLGVLIAHFA